MSKLIKQMQMDDLKKTFADVRELVFLNVVGLNATVENQVRLGLRKKGIRMQMVKNSLARRVLGELGLSAEKGWDGSTTLAWGGASIAELSKEIEGLAKKHEKFIKVKSAVSDGQEIAFEVALKMPTRLEAIGRVISLALAPASRLVGQILGPASSVASQIKTVGEKKEEEVPAPSPA
ncbi:MAG: 50S ribosomal protein L10 [Planctomycetes bacterium]|nr:50S ribosomal protein L10 [Planctomycetota bacterium]